MTKPRTIKAWAIMDKVFKEVIMFSWDGDWCIFREDQKDLAEYRFKSEFSEEFHKVVPVEIIIK